MTPTQIGLQEQSNGNNGRDTAIVINCPTCRVVIWSGSVCKSAKCLEDRAYRIAGLVVLTPAPDPVPYSDPPCENTVVYPEDNLHTDDESIHKPITDTPPPKPKPKRPKRRE